MIPKIIHYCWFGGSELPKSALKCIESWEKYFPDYEIKEWNESNFNINEIPYIKEAYAVKKYAFVSDYARFKIINENGGVYFDTDVEVIKSFDDIIEKGGFMGYETQDQINPGLGFAAEKDNQIIKKIVDYYKALKSFDNPDSTASFETVVQHTTRVLKSSGANIGDNTFCEICGIQIFPIEFFNPLDSLTGKLNMTSNTRSIHLYSKTWLGYSKFRIWLSQVVHRLIGTSLPHRIHNRLNNNRI